MGDPVQSDLPRIPDYIPTLDGWRAVAVLMVVVCHMPRTPETDSVQAMAGGLGVSIFFGLSGLLICTRLLRERDRTGGISLRKFYLRRITRIFPAAWAYLFTIGVLSYCGRAATSGADILSCLLCYRNFVTAEHGGAGPYYVGHFWSLAVEEQFYCLFPLVFLRLGARPLTYVLPGLAALVAAWRFIDIHHGISRPIVGDLPWHRFDYRADGLLWGCWAAVILWRFPGIAVRRHVGTVGVLAATALIVTTFWRGNVPAAVRFALPAEVLIALVLSATLLRPNSLAGRVLELRSVRWVGRLSYSVYLWQMLFFVAHPDVELEALRPWQSAPWNWLALLACAAFSYYFVERPFVRIGHRLTRGTAGVGPVLDHGQFTAAPRAVARG